MISRLKGQADERLGGLGLKLYRVGLTPNRLSLLGLLLTGIAALLIYQKWLLSGVLVLAAGAAADGADGLVARASGTASRRGGYLDSLTDRYSDALLFGALLLGGWLEPLGWGSWQVPLLGAAAPEAWALAALVGALATSYARAAAERLGVSQAGVGLVERPERLVLLALALLFSGLTGRYEPVTWALALLAVAGNLTVLQRARHFWRAVA